MTELLLGVDLGTGSTKAVLATHDGTVVATASRPHDMSLPRPGWAEVDAERVWWEGVVSIIRELTQAADQDPIRGVCVSGVGPCLLLCDQDIRPLRPAILYGIDTRATAEIAELTERYGYDKILERSGSALSTQAVGPKLLWVRRNEPDVWRRTARWYSTNSIVAARLTGEYILDHHTASQCDPLYGIDSHEWLTDWATDIAADLAFPRLAWPGEIVGTIHAAAANETGLLEGTPVCAGTVDAWAEAFSVGVRNPGDLMIMYGSTAFLVDVLKDRRSDPLLWTTTGVEPGSYTFAAGTSTAGSLTQWLQRLVGGAPFADLVSEAAAVPPGSDGLLVLPYFAGERTPVYDPDARGVIAGLTLRHRRGHLFRALYEGIAFGLRHILDYLDTSGASADRIVAVGGGTQGGLWTQIVSDVTGRTQQLPQQTIGACFGDALLAAIGSGIAPATTDWTRIDRTATPDPANHEIYQQLYQTYRDLYLATAPHQHQLAKLQHRAWPGLARPGEPQPSDPSGSIIPTKVS